MKVMIIGLDGLEYDLVVKYNLRGLMQRVYGKITIPRELYHDREPVPYTPKVWGTLLTGKPPSEHGARELWVYKNKFLEKIRWLPPLRWIKGKRLLLEKLGIRLERTIFKIDCPTILSLCGPSLAINVPGVNIWEEYNRRLSSLIARGEFKEAIRLAYRYADEVFNEFVDKARGGRDHVLGMVYTNLADIVGHLCWYKCPRELKHAYEYLNLWVVRLKHVISSEITLVVSDHGMQGASDGVTGNHSDHMFWSVNVNHVFKDIYEIPRKIVEWCKL